MEQDLIESLIVESISIYGHGVFYCPRTVNHLDPIYGEAPLSSYNNAYNFDMYIRSFDNYEGDGTFLSKFNLEIRDQTTFSVARRTFFNEIGSEESIERPQEGDLIYSKMMKRLFIVKFVKNTPIFYQMGALQLWDLVCEVFEYSNEDLRTGIPEIDAIQDKYSTNENHFVLHASDGSVILSSTGGPIVLGDYSMDVQEQDWYADNEEIRAEVASTDLINWDQVDPFSEGHI